MKISGYSNAEPGDRITHLEHLVAHLVSRVASLEQRATPEPLARRNAEECEAAGRRRAAIKQLLDLHPGPERGAAKRIHPYLVESGIRLSVRAVQHHITQLRKAAALRL